MRSPARVSVTAAVAAVMLAMLLPATASAQVERRLVLTKSNPDVTQRYDGLTSTRPFPNLGEWTYDECVDAHDYCAVIPITFDNEGTLNNTMTEFRITWRGSTNYQGRFFQVHDDGSVTQLDAMNPSDEDLPEGVNVRRTRHVDFESGEYAIAIRCVGSCGDDYTITGRYILGETYSPPERFQPRPQPMPAPTQTTVAGGGSAGGGSGGASEDPPPEVARPGEDGPMSTLALQPLAGEQQATPPSTRGTTITNIVMLALLALVVGIGGAMVTIKIRRDLLLRD